RHGAGAARLHRQPWLSAIERLDLALFVDRENHGMGGRVDIEAVSFSANFGSFDSLNVRMRCGASWWARGYVAPSAGSPLRPSPASGRSSGLLLPAAARAPG